MLSRTVVTAPRRSRRFSRLIAALSFASLLSIPLRGACPDFAAPVSNFTAAGAWAIAAGDFNGDGRPDLAVANRYAGNVSVLLATGPGTFAARVNYTTGSNPMSIVAADFDRDGKLDLAVTAFGNGSDGIGFLKGVGNGTFQPATTWPAHSTPVFLTAADFDRDGKLDLAVANSGTNDISIVKGNGNGTFGTAVNYAVHSAPQSIAVDDFDGDGEADLVVADYTGNDIAILLGNGAGAFGASVFMAMPGAAHSTLARPTSLTSGDFNRDGKRDLAVANSTSYAVAILLGNGSGGFGAPAMTDLEVDPHGITRGDFNGDGNDDLAVAQSDDNFPVYNDRVSILLGNGSGGFVLDRNIDMPDATQPTAVLAGDFNADGKTDLVSANSNTQDVSLFVNTGLCYVNCGTFAASSSPATTGAPKSIAFGDFNRDGKLDFVATSPSSGKLDVFLATGPAVFATAASYDAGISPQAVVAADFNRDGVFDLATGNAGVATVSVLLGNASGGFSAAVPYLAGNSAVSLAVGDFDRDGDLDIATADYGSGSAGILLGNGSGAFGSASSYTAGVFPQSVTVADFNRDGILDLALANQGSNSITILRGVGDGAFINGGHFDVLNGPVSVAAGDFNSDGLADLAAADSSSGDVAVLIATAPGSFAAAVIYTTTFAPSSLAVGDFNRDGSLDVAAAGSDGVWLLNGNGSGSFAAPSAVGTGFTVSCVAAPDVDGDGKLDLAVARSALFSAGILLNGCPAPDLTVVKSHTGTFTQGQNTRLYTIVVSNIAPTATAGAVTVTDTLPDGLTATVVDGSGWTCTPATLTCTRSDSLAGNSSYPAITLAVDVALNAPATVTNIATVSGGSQVNNANDTSSDPTAVIGYQDLTVVKTHAGNFWAGQSGATYTLTVTNVGRASTIGPVTLNDTLPAGLTATAMAGSGWTCTLAPLRCTRSDGLAAAASYAPVTLTVNVSASAQASVTNTATISGGGQQYTGNDTATDPTTVDQTADLTIEKKHSGNFTQGQTGATYSITVRNMGSVATSGTVTVTDALPAGLTPVGMSGAGWSCALATLTCSRGDVLAPAAGYPPVTLTVNVNSNAAATVTNTVSVSMAAETNPANNSATDPATVTAAVLAAPTNLVAAAVSTSAVSVSWDAVTGAVSYQVFRKTAGQPFSIAGAVELPLFADPGRASGTAYVYQVVAVNASASVSAPSNSDVATTMFFTDDPVVAGTTVVKSVHLTELRGAVDALRIAAGLPTAAFTDGSPAGLAIRAVHLSELRTGLDEARAALGLVPLVYVDASLDGLPVKAAHIRDVRNGVK